MTDPTTGEVKMTFVSFPFGLGLDQMDDAIADSKSSVAYNQLQEAKNGLKAYFIDQISRLPQGAEEICNLLQVQIRHAGKAVAATTGANPFLAVMSSMIASKKGA